MDPKAAIATKPSYMVQSKSCITVTWNSVDRDPSFSQFELVVTYCVIVCPVYDDVLAIEDLT